MFKGIGNICLVVRDIGRAVDFYSQKLGLKGEVWSAEEGIVYIGDIYLYLVRSRRSDSPAVGRTADFIRNPIGIDHLSFEVENIEKTGAELEARGIVFPGPVVTEPDGFRYRGFSDPDGNMLYIIQSPGPPEARTTPPWSHRTATSCWRR